MLLPTRRITARCIPHVATAFIEQNGGRPNIAAKTLATLWYLLVLPDAQNRLHRQLHRKRVPWYSPSRLFGIGLAAANIVTMPLSWAFLIAGRRNASRLAALSVLLNPPSIALSVLLVSEVTTALISKSCGIVRGTGSLIISPFIRKSSNSTESSNTPAPVNPPPAAEPK